MTQVMTPCLLLTCSSECELLLHRAVDADLHCTASRPCLGLHGAETAQRQKLL